MHELELSWPVKEELINLCFAFRLKECSHKQKKLLGYRMKSKASSCIKLHQGDGHHQCWPGM
jgi:hypothetical protein